MEYDAPVSSQKPYKINPVYCQVITSPRPIQPEVGLCGFCEKIPVCKHKIRTVETWSVTGRSEPQNSQYHGYFQRVTENTLKKCIRSVSYTHLDVYKRQILHIFDILRYIRVYCRAITSDYFMRSRAKCCVL